MFAYCNNNPVGNVDYTGFLPVVKTTAICDGGTSKFIDSQHDEPYADMSIGITNIAHGGCGPVAVFNAMQLLGRTDVTLESIVEYYKENDYFLLDGLLGSLPVAAVNYFEDQGYHVTVLTCGEIRYYRSVEEYADACILWYWYEEPSVGAHFVAIGQYGGTGIYFNWRSTPYRYDGYISDFMRDEDYGIAQLILIKEVN